MVHAYQDGNSIAGHVPHCMNYYDLSKFLKVLDCFMNCTLYFWISGEKKVFLSVLEVWVQSFEFGVPSVYLFSIKLSWWSLNLDLYIGFQFG